MQPAGSLKTLLADLADYLPVVQNGAGCCFLDGLGQSGYPNAGLIVILILIFDDFRGMFRCFFKIFSES